MSNANPQSLAGRVCVCVFAVAIGLYLFASIRQIDRDLKRDSDWRTYFTKDAMHYYVIAEAFASGDFSMSYEKGWPYRQPLFPLLIAAVMKVTNSDLFAIRMINVGVIFLQVVLGAGFRHSEIPVWPHIAGAFVVMASITWTAVALRKRFGNSAELSRARALLHAMFGIQFALGFGAYWARLASEKAGPTSLTVITTVTHTVVGALLFAFSALIAFMCVRLVPRRGELATAPSQVPAQ